MQEHICIRNPEYVAGTLQKPEIGVFTQTSSERKPIPWGRINPGETVWMKWTGGPIVAKAVITGFRQFENCSPLQLRNAVSEYALYDSNKYWETRPNKFNALAIYLENESWLDKLLNATGRSYGSSWIVFPDSKSRKKWMTLPPSSIKNRENDPRGPRTARPSLRFEVFRRDSYTCQYCGRRAPEFPLHVDHIIPWSKGGKTEIKNLLTACRECNLGKSNNYK